MGHATGNVREFWAIKKMISRGAWALVGRVFINAIELWVLMLIKPAPNG